jgi:anaerobic ribonucleoside-triphosphate reductase activating protein
MRYSGIIYNDITAAPGLCVSFFTQGCPHHCHNCHNPQTWDFEGGKEFRPELLDEIVEALTANGIERSLCIMGGEPLCSENEFLTLLVIKTVKEKLPDTPIYIWTGYFYEELLKKGGHMDQILEMADYLIDGPYIEDLRDITLEMRGSSNQRIIKLHD